MEDKYIFPPEIIENTAEYHFHSHNSVTKVIYKAVLFMLIMALLGMFFIKVDVNVQSTGLFRPISERNEIKPLVAGRIDSVFIEENSHVKAGQVLLTIRREILEGQGQLVEMQKSDAEDQLADLQKLIEAFRANNWSQRLELRSGVYSQQYSLFMGRISEARSRYQLAAKNHQRYSYLYKKRAISAIEYDQMKLEYDNRKNELALVGEEQGARWQAELNQMQMQNRELSTKNDQFTQEKDFYTLRAPVTGSIQQLKGIQPGTVVGINEVLGEISPDSGLIAETYVAPRDIGMIGIGTRANFQIDAFPYNQWGMVGGKVISISNDIFMESGRQPFFKVRCKLDKHHLKLKNGYVGRIKKGMTLQARFFVTRRTLFQLLYDKMDNWLNPNVTPVKEEKTTAAL